MVSPWFTTPWQLVFSPPQGCCSVFSATPRPLVRNPATSHYPSPHPVNHHGLLPASRAFSFSWGCCAAPATPPFWVSSPFPIPHPVSIPHRAASKPVARANWILIHPGACFARLARVAPFPPPLVWVVCYLLGLLGALLPGPAPASPGTRTYSPPGHLCLFFLSRATRGPSFAPFAPSRFPAACSLSALCPPAVHCGVFFPVVSPPPFSRCVSCLVVSCPCRVCWFFFYPPPCMHARQHCTGHRVTAPLCVRLRPLALVGRAPWRSPAKPRGRPSLVSLSSLPSLHSPPLPPLSPVSQRPSNCCSPAPCALCCSSLRRSCISPALTRLLASALSSVLPPSSAPGGLPSISSLMLERGSPVWFNAGHWHGVSLREMWCTFVPLLAPCVPILPGRPCPLGSPAFPPCCFYCRASCCPRAPGVCPLLTSAPPLPRHPAPSPPVSPSLPYSLPTRRHSEERRLPPPVCTFLSAVIAFAFHFPLFSTFGFHLCPIPLSLPFPVESGRTLTLSTLGFYRPQAMCYPRNPRLSPLPARHRYRARESIIMQTAMWSCMWMGKMMGRHLLPRVLVVERSYPSRGRHD